jgi:hypothetical protein
LDDYWVFERGSGEREVLDGGVEGSDVFADIEKSVRNSLSGYVIATRRGLIRECVRAGCWL